MKVHEGHILTVVLGIIGALVGGWLVQTVLHKGDVTGLNIEGVVIAVVGAIVVIVGYRLVTRQLVRP